MKIGVLALQGGFSLHEKRLAEFECESLRVASIRDLHSTVGLVVPGGESSTFLKLSSVEFREELRRLIHSGMPVLATCAGLILLARCVVNPEQESLGLIDVEVKRNAYGRQAESFITPHLHWTKAGKEELQKSFASPGPVEGVFIRAPKITNVGNLATVLLEHQPPDAEPEPVLVRQGNRFGATFHPELSPKAGIIHKMFLDHVTKTTA